MDLLDELQTRILCGDGAIGTLLLDQGIPLERCFEELCLSDPERIRSIHERYMGAGARVIETNTFGANAVRLERFGLEGRVSEINRAATHIARGCARGKAVYVAGSVGPLGLSGEEAARRGIDREFCFREQICALLDGGVDLVLFETFMDFDEMEIALRAWKTIGPGLALCSFACGAEGKLGAELLVEEAFEKLRSLGVSLVGVNCIDGPRTAVQVLRRIRGEGMLTAYPNAGVPKSVGGRLVYPFSPEDFAESARDMIEEGARLIGGCCGTTPEHIAALAATVAGL